MSLCRTRSNRGGRGFWRRSGNRRRAKQNQIEIISPWGSGRWEESGESQEQEKPDVNPDHSQPAVPGRSCRREEPENVTRGGTNSCNETAMMETLMEPRRHRARVTPKVQRAKAELTAYGTLAEMGIRKTDVEPVRLKTKVEPEGWKAEVQSAASNP